MEEEKKYIAIKERSISNGKAERDMSDHYYKAIFCNNCNFQGYVYIKKGIPKELVKCPECECVRVDFKNQPRLHSEYGK